MPRPSNAQEARAREAEAWRLRLRGYTARGIAEKMGVSHQAVLKMLERQEKALKEELVTEALPVKLLQTAQLQQIQQEAIEAWDRSKEDAQTERIVEKAIAPKRIEMESQPQGGALVRQRRGDLPDDFDPEGEGNYLDGDGEEIDAEERARRIAERAVEAARGEDPDDLGPMLIERTTTSITIGQAGDPRFLQTAMKAMEDIRKIWGLDAPVKQEISGGLDVVVTDEERAARVAALLDRADRRRQAAEQGKDS